MRFKVSRNAEFGGCWLEAFSLSAWAGTNHERASLDAFAKYRRDAWKRDASKLGLFMTRVSFLLLHSRSSGPPWS